MLFQSVGCWIKKQLERVIQTFIANRFSTRRYQTVIHEMTLDDVSTVEAVDFITFDFLVSSVGRILSSQEAEAEAGRESIS